MVIYYVAEKSALEKCVKELEETLATRNTEAEKAAKDATAREEQFVNRVAFLSPRMCEVSIFEYLFVYLFSLSKRDLLCLLASMF